MSEPSDELPSEPPFFVWVDGCFGPEPQLWWGDGKRVATGSCRTLFKRQLTEEDRGETFTSLQTKYPPPAKPQPLRTKLDDMNARATK